MPSTAGLRRAVLQLTHALAAATMTSTTVFVSCDGIKLKLTCTPELLKKPFEECLVAPFLGAFNKKRGTSFTPAQLPKVEIEGQLVKDIGLSGAHVLVSSAPMAASPNVVLFLPSNAAGTSSACAAAVEQLLLLDPTGSDDGVPARAALKALRTAVKEAPMAAEPAVNPKIISLLAAYCCLLDDERGGAPRRPRRRSRSATFSSSPRRRRARSMRGRAGALPRLISNFDATIRPNAYPAEAAHPRADCLPSLAPPRHQDTQRRLSRRCAPRYSIRPNASRYLTSSTRPARPPHPWPPI